MSPEMSSKMPLTVFPIAPGMQMLPRLVRLAVPIMITNLLQVAYNLVDAWFLGRLNAEAVSVPAIAFNVIFLLSVFGLGFAQAGTTVISQAHGAGEPRRVDFFAAQTLGLVTTAGVVMCIIGLAATEPLLVLLRVPESVLDNTQVYMRIIFSGIPFMFFFFVLQGIFQGVGDSMTPLCVQLGTVVLNAVLDPLFIFGLGPLPAMGVAGAATATFISRGVSAAAILVILLKRPGKIKVRVHAGDMRPDWGCWRRLAGIGLPVASGMGMAALGFTVLQGVVNGFGVAVVAAFGVGNRIIGMFNMPAIGLSRATASLVGQELGAGSLDGAREVVRVSVMAMLVFIVPAMTFTFFFGNWVMRFFVDDPEVVSHGATLFRIVSVSVIPFTLFTVIIGAFHGGGVTRPMMVLNILRLWGMRVPLAMIFAWRLGAGPNGIWYAMFVSNIVTATAGFIMLRRGKWLKRIDFEGAVPEREAAGPVSEGEPGGR